MDNVTKILYCPGCEMAVPEDTDVGSDLTREGCAACESTDILVIVGIPCNLGTEENEITAKLEAL